MITKDELTALVDNTDVIDIPMASIVFEPKLYSRKDGIDKLAVNDYAKKLTSMPPILINQDNLIIDGVHRYHAALKLEQQIIKGRIIQLARDDIDIAGLIIDLMSGIRHPENDVKSMCIKKYSEDVKENQRLFMELNVPESTFYAWTADIRKKRQKELNKSIAIALLNPFRTQQMVADEYNINQTTISRLKDDILCRILAIRNLHILDENEYEAEQERIIGEIEKADLDFLKPLMDFEPLLYNIWNTAKGDDSNDRFGHFPIVFMKNVLYRFTKPFDFVYDPFGGGGTTADACQEMYRQWYLTDLTPDPSLTYIDPWDIKDGLPEMPKPDLVFLDPPYWIQAENKYSEKPEDLGNMTLDSFNDVMSNLLIAIKNRKVPYIALVIQPTQYKNDFNWIDHIFDMNNILQKWYKISMRYIIPYSTQQYIPQQVMKAKELNKCLGLNRDLIVWERI